MKRLISWQGRFVLILFLSFLVELLLTFSKLIPYNKHEAVFFYAVLFTLPMLIACFFLWQEVKYRHLSPSKYLMYEGIAAFLLAGFPSVQFLRTFYQDLPLFLIINGIFQLFFLCLSFTALAWVEIKEIPVEEEDDEEE